MSSTLAQTINGQSSLVADRSFQQANSPADIPVEDIGSLGRVVLVTGRMRSGTSVFRRLLASAPGIVDVGEVFHRGTYLDFNFYRFCARRADPHPRHEADSIRRRWREYVASTFERTGADTLVIDAKAEYFRAIKDPEAPGVWPIFPVTAGLADTVVVHLRRRNLLAQIVSLELACKSNIWGVLSVNAEPSQIAWMGRIYGVTNFARAAPDQKIVLDPSTVVDRITASLEWDREIEGHVSDAHRFFYEELFDADGKFSASTIDRCSRILDLPPTAFSAQPAHCKQTMPPLLSHVENWTEIRRALCGSPHEWMLDEAVV